MKSNLFLILIFFVVFASCNNQSVNNNILTLDKNTALKREKDSLRNVISQRGKEKALIVKPPNKEKTQYPIKGGKHPISLQWISWDILGEVILKPLGGGWYSISGSQKNKDGDELKIEGKIKRLSEKELEFEGTIMTKMSTINNGEPCVKNGKQLFYAKDDRKYFRLQNMTNCEGGMLVDYVDIYPGTSSL